VRSPARIVVICSANACRSPVVERLLHARLAEHGIDAVVRSAGTIGGPTPVHRYTLRAAADVDIDLSDHRPRKLTPEILTEDGAALVVTMTRQHRADVSAMQPAAAARTFTLPELARIAQDHGADPMTRLFTEWVSVLATTRGDPDSSLGTESDDIADPYGGPRHGHAAMIEHTDRLVRSWVPLLAASLDPAEYLS
jgi:protein-tyrosine phosphatase